MRELCSWNDIQPNSSIVFEFDRKYRDSEPNIGKNGGGNIRLMMFYRQIIKISGFLIYQVLTFSSILPHNLGQIRDTPMLQVLTHLLLFCVCLQSVDGVRTVG